MLLKIELIARINPKMVNQKVTKNPKKLIKDTQLFVVDMLYFLIQS